MKVESLEEVSKDLTVLSRSRHQTRLLLLVAFGGLLLLLAAMGLSGLSNLGSIQTRNEQIRNEYIGRDHILEQLRSEIFLSGTYVRDLLLEPDAARADLHRRELAQTRSHIESLVSDYTKVLQPEERAPFGQFRQQLHSYFESLQPALTWNVQQRRQFGYAFMTNLLLPRRMVVVHLADQLQQVSEKQWVASSHDIGTLFANFRLRLLLFLLLTFAVGLLLAGVSFWRILVLEKETAKQLRETLSARSALQDLSTRLLEVQESERKSIARELHDEVGQALSGILLGIANLAAMLQPQAGEDVGRELQKLRRLTEKTVATVRDMSLLLRPSMLDDLGLVPALEWQAREVSRNSGLNVAVQAAENVSDELSDDGRTCIYRVVQEALRNCVRHARASQARVQLIDRDGRLHLTIEDDGEGFTPDREKGLGLLGMEERVRHLGGLFSIASEPGRGSRISVQLPLSTV